MQIVNVKHFIDHFVRVLPSAAALQTVRKKSQDESFATPNVKDKPSNEQLPRKIASLQQMLNEEIEDCIDSVAKLSPLVPCYIKYTSAEIAAASIVIAIKHSIKTMITESKFDETDLKTLKELYKKWAWNTFVRYRINKEKIREFTEYLKDFLAKVCD